MKRRGFIAPLLPPKRVSTACRGQSGRYGGGGNPSSEAQGLRQGSVIEEDLYGIPLSIWEDRIEEQVPETTVVCPAADVADLAPVSQTNELDVLRPTTTNLLGINISDNLNETSSEDEEDDSENENKENHEEENRGEDIRTMDLDEKDDDESVVFISNEGDNVDLESINYRTIPPELEAEQEVEEFVADGPSNNVSSIDDFHLALMIFTITADISTNQYKALIEVLALASVDSIASLPKSLKTLRERYRKSFPLSVVKARSVEINTESVPPKTENPHFAYYFDTSEYCKLWMSNPKMVRQMYYGLGEIVDNVSELWHGEAWMESVRTTSGNFAYIDEQKPGLSVNRVVLLPSDCVIFKEASGGLALGRVKCVGIDRRLINGTIQNTISAIINRLIPPTLLPPPWSYHAMSDEHETPTSTPYKLAHSILPELVMIEIPEIIPCAAIATRVWVFFTDYSSVSGLRESLLPHEPTHCVRSIAYRCGKNGKPLLRPVHQRHRVAAEIELNELTREYVLANFVGEPSPTQTSPPITPATVLGSPDSTHESHNVPPKIPAAGLRRVSLPFSIFLDGFGLYRNAYHSLKGMYITPASLDAQERERLINLFVLMIGPFGCGELEMASCLQQDSCAIGRGLSLQLSSGEKIFVTAFPLLFTGDMPQQNQNAGNKTHLAEFGCRSCMVADKDRGNLNINIVATGRYMAPTRRFYEAAIKLPTRLAQDKALQSQGLNFQGPYFKKCYAMLDPQRANPNDSMHAELRLAKYFEEALLDGLLSPAGIAAYREAWEDVKMPYKWGQPQNPVNHKGSMVFSEHGRIAIINPFVLMHMFTNNTWKRKSVLPERERNRLRLTYVKKDISERLQAAFGREGVIVVDHKHQIVRAAFGLAMTINLTLKETLTPADRAQFGTTVVQMRSSLRQIFACATSNDKTFKNYANVPNIHLGLHYEQDIINFGTSRNATTMMGEQKHKVFKAHAPHTNSKDNDLQLMKMMNTAQTVRFMLDGTFQGSCSSAVVSSQLHSIIERCPTLNSFLGQATCVEEVDSGTNGIEDSKSAITSTRTGKQIPLKEYSPSDRSFDTSAVVRLYKTDYGITLSSGMRFRIHYWGYVGGDPRADQSTLGGKLRRFRVKVNEFLKLRGSPAFYRVRRMLTTTMGTLMRLFFVLEVLDRVYSEELSIAPYPVLRATNKVIMVGLDKIDPRILHFVSKGVDVWWYNPFVPYFL